MTKNDFYQMIQNRDKQYRKGQYAFNLMTQLCPEFAERVRGTVIDPFYIDGKLKHFVDEAEKQNVFDPE